MSSLKSEWSAVGDHESGEGPATWSSINATVLQSLMLTNRLEVQDEFIAAKRSGHVVLDRYTVSAEVYGALDGLDPEWLQRTNAALAVQPDVFVLLDAPVEESFRRRPERRDRYEVDREYLARVRERYLEIFNGRAAKRAARAQ